MARPRSEYSDEDWEYIQRQVKAERGIRRHLRAAVIHAIERHGPDYGRSVISHELSEIWRDFPIPEPQHKVYIKRPISRKLAKQVFERDGYRCVHCGDWHDLCADHIIPESKGGGATLENLQTLCRPCNTKKGDRL